MSAARATHGPAAAAGTARSPARRRWLASGVALVLLATGGAAQHGDHQLSTITDGLRYVGPNVDIRADRALLWFDVDEIPALDREAAGELPRRGLTAPSPRRRLGDAELKRRLAAFLRAAQRGGEVEPIEPSADAPFSLELVRAMYLEGNVSVIQDGRELAHAGAIYFSAPDDRVILTDAELRLWSTDRRGGSRVFTVRGDRLVRQGIRTTGRDVSLTSCTAGEPHFEVKLGQIEVIERETDFEVRTVDGALAFSGTGVLPLPNTTFRTSDQSHFPLQNARLGYSSAEGAFGGLDVGGSLNDIGKALHAAFGGPENDFRGDWLVGVGFNEQRGFPLDAGLTYEVPGLYRGYAQGFYLHDQGTNRREITRNFDGSLITDDQRYLVRTENRIHFDDATYLDLTAWDAGDPAVWSEFFPREYHEEKIPETSAYVRHADENRLATVNARVNLADFSYGQDRALAPFFTEELPLATFDVFSQPLLTLPAQTPLLLTSSGSAGYLRKDFDATLAMPDQSVVRIDEDVQLSTPFRLGPVGIEPFASARVTYYDRTLANGDATRGAFLWGIRAGTWLGRSWSWAGEDGTPHALRHVISPAITVRDRFYVSEDPAEFEQFDPVDAVTEQTEVSVRVLNRLDYRGPGEQIDELVWFDLEQLVYPDADRDNGGDEIGLLLYKLLLTPRPNWLPLSTLDLLFKGKHDWQEGRERTLDIATRFGKILALDWRLEYRADETADGTITYGASTGRVGRWEILGTSQYNLEQSRTQNYQVRMYRHDHDWIIELGVVFDTIGDETSVFVNFQPTLGGLFTPRDRAYVVGG